jgi:hypothetical protein
MSETTSTNTGTDRPSGWHPVNVGHLVMGLALLGLVAVWALIEGDVVPRDDLRWLLPLPWVLAGAAGLTASAVTGRRRHSVRRTGWVNAPAPTEATSTDTNTTDPVTHELDNPQENP